MPKSADSHPACWWRKLLIWRAIDLLWLLAGGKTADVKKCWFSSSLLVTQIADLKGNRSSLITCWWQDCWCRLDERLALTTQIAERAVDRAHVECIANNCWLRVTNMCRKQRKEQEVKEKRVKTKWSRNIAES